MAVRLIGGIAELAPHFDGFILDLWGVIHDGVAPMPGAIDCLSRLKDAGKRVVLLSNAPRRSDDAERRRPHSHGDRGNEGLRRRGGLRRGVADFSPI